MYDFSICIKTYRRDLAFFETLAESIEKYNVSKIPIVVVCPASDLSLFSSRIPGGATTVCDEDLVPSNREIRGLSKGYITQELVKLNFYKLSFSKNVLFVDSDSKFIREFDLSDFFDEHKNLYTVLSQDKDLIVDPSYRAYSVPRTQDLRRIYSTLGVVDSRLLQVQMNQLVSCDVLRELMEGELPRLGLDEFQALHISPFEYNWYTVWLLKSKIIPIIPIEPLFKTFHVREQYFLSLIQGINEIDLQRAYIGVVYNSTWYRSYLKETRLERLKYDLRSDKYFTRSLRSVKAKIFNRD